MEVQALDDLIPQDVLKSTALSATNWDQGQNRDSNISRVKTLLKRTENKNQK